MFYKNFKIEKNVIGAISVSNSKGDKLRAKSFRSAKIRITRQLNLTDNYVMMDFYHHPIAG